ncbi:MAG TPA: GNAT family N-acetyltransferase [Bacilli bacterium]
MDSIEIRPAIHRDELECAFDIWGTVFPEERSFFQKRLDFDPDYTLDTTWLALINGQIVSAVQIFPYRMYWGSVFLKVGGIGNVATLPEYRGLGLAKRILRMQCEYMRKNEFDLSLLLTGINSFYSRIGWQTIPRQEWTVDAAVIRKSAHSTLHLIRTFDEKDLGQVSQIYDEINSRWIAPMKRSKAYWIGQMKWETANPGHFLVMEEQGRILAYMRYVLNGNELRIRDCCYREENEQEALNLLSFILAKEQQVESVRAELPSDHVMAVFFRKIGGQPKTDNGYMWRMFDLNETLRKLAPELSKRICKSRLSSEADLSVALLLGVGNQLSLLKISHEAVEVQPVREPIAYNLAIDLTEEEWLRILLTGCGAFGKPTRAGYEYIRVLFPDCPHVFWHADHF